MTIYILDSEPAKIAEWIDDKPLTVMIKDVAQVLCNVHHDLIDDKFFESSKYSIHCMRTRDKWKLEIPLETIFASKTGLLQWSQWARECRANYLYLIELGSALMAEHAYPRCLGSKNKYMEAILWARDNVPDLPWTFTEKLLRVSDVTPKLFPLVMPKRYTSRDYEYKEKYNRVIDEEKALIQSYCNYYQAKLLKQKQCMKHDACIYSQQNNCLRAKPQWTRREAPAWIQLA